MNRKLVIKRDYPWAFGGPDLALCFEDGTPLPCQSVIKWEPFEGDETGTFLAKGFGRLTITFAVKPPTMVARDGTIEFEP